MDDRRIAAYLDRIGLERPRRIDLEAMAELQLRHLLAVPFENLSIHLGEAIVLEEDSLFEKVVSRRRGGFCYELNGLFAALLRALGFRVSMLAARVQGSDRIGPPFDHLALCVDLEDGRPWLVDVGFGRFSTRPIRLDERGPQPDREGTFLVADAPGGDLDVTLDGKPQYRIESRARTLDEFEPTCWWHQTSPKSYFTQSLVCSRLTDRGRVTLSGRTLIETTSDGRSEQTLAQDADVLEAYRTRFGIELDRVPSARSAAR